MFRSAQHDKIRRGQVDSSRRASLFATSQMGTRRKIYLALSVLLALATARSTSSFAQADPAAEPAVLAVAKVLPAVVNINTERVIRRAVRDPIDDFYAP